MSIRSGSWYLTSKSDPRWNTGGRDDACGGFEMPQECRVAIERLKEKLGEMPADLTWGYMKD
jgi:hypothetical protein